MDINITKLVDDYVAKRAARLAKSKELKALEVDEVMAKQVLIIEMKELGMMVVGSGTSSVKRKTTPKPRVTDWAVFTAYVKKHDAFDVFQRRLNDGAIKERMEAGEDVPALDFYDAESLTVSKVS